MPQPTIKPYNPKARTEEFTYHEGGNEEDDAPLVMTVRKSLLTGEIEPIREWFRGLFPDPDDGPDPDDQSKEAQRERRRLAKEHEERTRNATGWAIVAPYVLAWNVVDEDGTPVPPPCETDGDSFAQVPAGAFTNVMYWLLGGPTRRVDAARKPSSASEATDAPSPATSSPSGTAETP